MAYVYKHIRLDKNEPFYIGIGSDKKYRRSKCVKGRNQHWHNVINISDHTIEIIEDNLTWKEACEREKYWIKFYGRKDIAEGTLVNMTDGGDGILGAKRSDDTKKKQSISKIGDLNPMRRPEVAKKSGAAHKGVLTGPFSAERRAKMGTTKGHIKSPETCMKLSIAHKGKSLPDSFFEKMCKNSILKYDLDGIFIEEIRSASYAAKCVGGNTHGVRRVCDGRNQSYRGFLWKYKNGEFVYDITDETRHRLSVAGTGKKQSDETKNKISKSLTGLVRTPEQCRRISDAHPGYIVLKYDLDDNFIEEYQSLRKAAASVHGYRYHIKRSCNGKSASYKGFVWKYKNR